MKKRILIVDDEPLILSQMSKALYAICGFHGEIITAANGEDAIKEIDCSFYNICFLDIRLPDMNGLDVMKKIKKMSPDTVIAIMTGSYITEDMERTIGEGASLFLEKPFDFSKIKFFMNKVLGMGGVLYREQSSG
jgi:DNA-binding NtrC family response regulator